MPPSGTSRPQRRSDVKKSIAVLGVEAGGIRGVRLEENGADWNCIDSGFWPIGSSAASPQAAEDEEGLQIMREIGRNMAWLMKCIEAGRAAGIPDPIKEKPIMTNFIR